MEMLLHLLAADLKEWNCKDVGQEMAKIPETLKGFVVSDAILKTA